MAYVMVEDDTAAIELLCFSKVLDTCGAYLKENQAVVVRETLRPGREVPADHVRLRVSPLHCQRQHPAYSGGR
ncbi:MAG: hypothetical protein V8R75_04425 [Oscillospiraceae bacterium]